MRSCAAETAMRLWTIHPKYLDVHGLVALWREALLARAVLRGRTKGYRRHPQLERFRAQAHPVSAINAYLAVVAEEAGARGYSFDRRKVGPVRAAVRMTSTTGQLEREWRHLLLKLRSRDQPRHLSSRRVRSPDPNPLFRIRRGPAESWERSRREPGSGSGLIHAG
jgi:hypothetical protein